MYKVLIVDDEPLIREGLRTIVDWEELGFTVAGVASDGVDALAKLPQLQPDLLIIDIRMPGMNGLALMRSIREQFDPAPRFIVLSGHADFDYAREALLMRADGYILKPVDEDELSSALVSLKRTLDEQEGMDGKLSSLSWSLERTAVSLLTGEGQSPPKEALNALRFGGPPYDVVLIKLQSRGEVDAPTASHVKNRLFESFEASGKGVVFSLDPHLGLILAGRATESAANYREMKRICSDNGVDFTAVSGGAVERLEELRRSYRAAEEGMKLRFLLEGDHIYRAEEAMALMPADRETDRAFGEADGDKLLLALDIGSQEAAVLWILETGEAMRGAGMDEQDIKSVFAQLFTQALSKLERNRPEVREQCRAFASEVLKLYGEYRFSGLLARLTELAGKMADAFRSYGNDKQVQKMVELIRRNYAENLKLESLADVFGYNSSYLGKLFKSKMGESFNTYLDKVRIDRAKELLEQGMKVYQVAERVGYSNVDYFHGKFRKYVGVAPSAYRKK
ncbi:response regulator transcription factor [Cohnella lubricantis]|uniref:Response regulator transcription factor n=1 Tax=Cohnella lubricantis TaxID=2163172 RepID=A0A841TJY8_9BACL|nr:response regulator transcription factor [Cohnella lubricantis]MBB6678801.1 response regulator transcription factor [Cohnella lubricantis]MBP2119475.1 two-component system response regulator YesN [Cohnella lubricantis]